MVVDAMTTVVLSWYKDDFAGGETEDFLNVP
jgi:hypothetical protein